MKIFKLSITSLILSAVALVALFITNYKIAATYISADGKTKALFGIVELLSFSYKYYFLLPGLSALIFAILAIRKQESKRLSYVALIFSILSITLIFLQPWKLIV